MYRDNTSVVNVHNTRLFICMSLSFASVCLSLHPPPTSPSLSTWYITHLKASSLTIHGAVFAIITLRIELISPWLSKHQQACVRRCSSWSPSLNMQLLHIRMRYKCTELASYCTLPPLFTSYVWPWKVQVNIPGLVWLLHQVTSNDEAWSRAPSQWVRGRWYGALPRMWQP